MEAFLCSGLQPGPSADDMDRTVRLSSIKKRELHAGEWNELLSFQSITDLAHST